MVTVESIYPIIRSVPYNIVIDVVLFVIGTEKANLIFPLTLTLLDSNYFSRVSKNSSFHLSK